ncbi:MAG: hypothetical protein H6680_08980 [Desulfobacteraceae bacterium]|nr:hypothetical protein [Desulfobacteraceae bacterium]
MEIKIGKPLDLRLMEQGEKRRGGSRSGELRAKIIGLRNSRKNAVVLDRGLRDRRTKRLFRDPSNSKVITLLIENGNMIPDDIETGNYKISIKFTKE